MSNYSSTFKLFKKLPTFWSGFSAALSIFSDDSRVYNLEKTSREADFNSLHADWVAIGQDLEYVFKEHEQRKQKV